MNFFPFFLNFSKQKSNKNLFEKQLDFLPDKLYNILVIFNVDLLNFYIPFIIRRIYLCEFSTKRTPRRKQPRSCP